MPEQAIEIEVTNSGQPQVAVISPATELELAREASITPVANVTVEITPAAE